MSSAPRLRDVLLRGWRKRCPRYGLVFQRNHGDTILAAPLLATLRERKGVALALDYLVRVYMPDEVNVS